MPLSVKSHEISVEEGYFQAHWIDSHDSMTTERANSIVALFTILVPYSLFYRTHSYISARRLGIKACTIKWQWHLLQPFYIVSKKSTVLFQFYNPFPSQVCTVSSNSFLSIFFLSLEDLWIFPTILSKVNVFHSRADFKLELCCTNYLAYFIFIVTYSLRREYGLR